MPQPNGFWDSLNQSVQNLAPLAIKKWELDTQVNNFNQQLAETKRQHDLTSGLKLLEMGDTTNAASFLNQAGMKVDPSVLSASPQSRLNQMKVEEATRALTAKKNIASDIQAMMAPKEETIPNFPSGDPLSGFTATTPGKNPTTEDLVNIITKHDPTSAVDLGLRRILASSEASDKMADLKLKLADIVGQTKLDAAKMLSDSRLSAAIVGANSREGKEPVVRVKNEDGSFSYVPRSEAAGQRAPGGGVTPKVMADAEAKLLANSTKREAEPYAKLYNEQSKTDRYEWKPGALWGGEWVKVPKTGTGTTKTTGNMKPLDSFMR